MNKTMNNLIESELDWLRFGVAKNAIEIEVLNKEIKIIDQDSRVFTNAMNKKHGRSL